MIADAVSQSKSVFDVLRFLNVKLTGGNHSHIKRRISHAGLDIAHFVNSACWQRGKPSKYRHAAVDILVDRSGSNGRRSTAVRLRRALLEIGREYSCAVAKCYVKDLWLDTEIVLEIDHIDSNWLDDRAENLQFLCPNCHAVKTKIASFKRRTRKTQTNRTDVVRVRKSSIPKVLKMCPQCGNRIGHKSVTCKKCRPQPNKIVWPDIALLIAAKQERRVWNLAKELGVSDAAIHKRIKRHLKR